VAILWLRLIAAIFALYGMMDALLGIAYLSGYPDEAQRAFHGAVWYALGGLGLWYLSPAIGKLVARGLDDGSDDTPAV
jgi:hypothetical protein